MKNFCQFAVVVAMALVWGQTAFGVGLGTATVEATRAAFEAKFLNPESRGTLVKLFETASGKDISKLSAAERGGVFDTFATANKLNTAEKVNALYGRIVLNLGSNSLTSANVNKAAQAVGVVVISDRLSNVSIQSGPRRTSTNADARLEIPADVVAVMKGYRSREGNVEIDGDQIMQTILKTNQRLGFNILGDNKPICAINAQNCISKIAENEKAFNHLMMLHMSMEEARGNALTVRDAINRAGVSMGLGENVFDKLAEDCALYNQLKDILKARGIVI